MNISFYTARTGLLAYQNGIDIVSHNVSNVSTVGYKSTSATFRELVYSRLDQNANKETPWEEADKTGHGVRMIDDALNMADGNVRTTGYDLDFAVLGNGFFAIDRMGQTLYTKNGAFELSIEGDDVYLVSTDGSYILDQNYEKIIIPRDEQSLLDTDSIVTTVGIFGFDNPEGLQREEGSSFSTTAISGEAYASNEGEYDLLQGALEQSNTSLAKEMADIIVLQKAYQFSAKVLQTADEVEQIVNTLRQ